MEVVLAAAAVVCLATCLFALVLGRAAAVGDDLWAQAARDRDGWPVWGDELDALVFEWPPLPDGDERRAA